ncbi:MAG: carboxypeptidase-like regulatory domain-containing protein [Flavobacterium sp.]|uniref:carboxypeptidase-like regulatory domain-containing protein n=1 Tax=Flavobacterium sp. TaxID=239 RepID=UPI0022C8D939|nr:carboxypeptidase-like regulatory domain-containing protein [Flavobacterium sp.]MCZ8196616.1 carboxypeptidase-like regulatory domain-containing protein [Flavobacterium sp.]
MKKSNHPRNKSILFLMFILFCINGNSQQISGTVYDEDKKPLSNVEILNQNNFFVTLSNVDGSFIINGKTKDILKFSYLNKQTILDTINNVEKNKIYFEVEPKIVIQQPTPIEKPVLKSNPFKNVITGKVYDDSGPLPGANVKIKGTKIGTQTNFDGYYGIDAKIGDVLEISFLGLKTVIIKVNNKVMNVRLDESGSSLSEVVVTSLGIKKEKKSLGYSIAGIKVTSDETTTASTSKVAGNKIQKAGQLTAGEVNDFSHYEYWQGLTTSELNQWKNHWKLNPTYRYSLILKNKNGFPIINKTVHLKNENEIVWTAKTDNTGRAELWVDPNDLLVEKSSFTELQIIDEEQTILAIKPKEFHKGINFYTYEYDCAEYNKINIAFAIDATGSMGDEISYLQAELFDVIERTKKEFPRADLSIGSLFYRDKDDEYLVKNFDFTSDIQNLISFIKMQNANGGGDYPEAVIEALGNSIEKMNWDEDARAKLLFLLLDAPPHYSEENIIELQNLAKKAAEKGIRIIPIAASGIDKSTEYLMRSLALETNGTYLFISNHSGIGDNHIEPSTETYKVELLNDLILRIIIQFSSVNNCNSEEKNYSKNTKIEENLSNLEEINLKYYPNPTSNFINITTSKEVSELYLYDTTGKLILYKTEKSKDYKIDLSDFPNAIYYLKVIVGEKDFFGKIIKRN